MPESFSSAFVFKRSSVVIARSRRRISSEVNDNSRCQKQTTTEGERNDDKDRFEGNGLVGIIIIRTIWHNNKHNHRRQSRDKKERTAERERRFSFSSCREEGGPTCAACLMMRMSVLFFRSLFFLYQILECFFSFRSRVFVHYRRRHHQLLPYRCRCRRPLFFFASFSRLDDIHDDDNNNAPPKQSTGKERGLWRERGILNTTAVSGSHLR